MGKMILTLTLILALAGVARADDLNARLRELESGATSDARINDAGTNSATAKPMDPAIAARYDLGGERANLRREFHDSNQKIAEQQRVLDAVERQRRYDEIQQRVQTLVHPCPFGGQRSVDGTTCGAGQ